MSPFSTGADRAPTGQKPVSARINVGDKGRVVSALAGGTLVLYALGRPSPFRLMVGVVGGGLLYRGVTGHCHVFEALGLSSAKDQDRIVEVEQAVTIGKPVEEVYGFFRNLENLPRFMSHLESVRLLDQNHSHWVAKAPAGQTVSWDAEIQQEIPNELISWRALPESQIFNEGIVRFVRAPGNRGTEVHVRLRYEPPMGMGKLGALIARFLGGEEPSLQLDDDLHHLKELLEAGEIPTTRGQPSGRQFS